MATPAQIANDMDAQAKAWRKVSRAAHIAATCEDAAQAIRILLSGERLDGRTWNGLHQRLLNLEQSSFVTGRGTNLTRARLCLEELRRQA